MYRKVALIMLLALLSACGTSDLATSPTAVSFPASTAPRPTVQTNEMAVTPAPTAFATRLPRPTPKPQALLSPISSISFVDDSHGWLAVDATILVTDDGGVHWTRQCTAITPILLSFTSLRDGWASFGERLFSTSDGGATWQSTATIFANIAWMACSDNQTGWLSTPQGVFQTHDASATWQEAATPCNKAEFQGPLQFLGQNRLRMICPIGGLAGIRPNRLFESRDGGKQWQLVRGYTPGREQPGDLPAAGFVNTMSFVNGEQGWVAANDYGEVDDQGRYGILAQSNNGGRSWERVHDTPKGEYVSIQRTSANHGYVVAHTSVDTTLYGTSDGGQRGNRCIRQGLANLCHPTIRTLSGSHTLHPIP